MTIEESDMIILFFSNSDADLFELTPEQAEKVKLVWGDLHDFDENCFYSFNNSYTRLRKTRIPEAELKIIPRNLLFLKQKSKKDKLGI